MGAFGGVADGSADPVDPPDDSCVGVSAGASIRKQYGCEETPVPETRHS